MPKIPDFSKFDLQNIVNSVKTMLNPEPTTPKVEEGDPIGAKIVQISTLLQNVSHSQAQAAKDLNQVNNLLNDLYKDLEAFRKLEAEMRFKQQTEAQQQASHGSGPEVVVTPGVHSTGEPTASTVDVSRPTTGDQTHVGVGEPTHEKIEQPGEGLPPFDKDKTDKV